MAYSIGDVVLINNKRYILTQSPEGLKEYYGDDKVRDGEWGVLPETVDIVKKGLVEDIVHKNSIGEVVDDIDFS